MPLKILIIADWYLPGYKAGGLITALANLTDSIGNEFTVSVLTRDRDMTDSAPYEGIIPEMDWRVVGKARVLYTADLSIRHIRQRIIEVAPDVIYLNSFFSPLVIKVLLLHRLRLLPRSALVIAPRGEFSPGALMIKRKKKSIYRKFALRAGLYARAVWHASSELEREQIAVVLRVANKNNQIIHVAWDLPNRDWLNAATRSPNAMKATGARIVFISRISPKKNLLFALETLGKLTGSVEFDIYGPIDDQEYWKQCQSQMDLLPGNVTASYRGTVPRESVPTIVSQYDFFLLPTLGENFGYVILEALAAGCPVILSDQTPWRDSMLLQAGWSLALQDVEAWRRVLQECVDMEPRQHAAMSLQARKFAQTWAKVNNHSERTVQLFNLAVQTSHV